MLGAKFFSIRNRSLQHLLALRPFIKDQEKDEQPTVRSLSKFFHNYFFDLTLLLYTICLLKIIKSFKFLSAYILHQLENYSFLLRKFYM